MEDTETSGFFAYLRKSNGRKPIPRQRSLTAAHVTGIGGRIIREFTDADSTAYRKPGAPRPSRAGFDAMLTALRASPGTGIAAYHADRITRDGEDTETLITVCSAGRNPVETYSGGRYELWTATGRKRLRDDATAAAYEVDHGRERVLAARAEVARQGRWLGGKRPFGWEPDPAPAGDDGCPLLDDDGNPVRGILRLAQVEADAIAAGCRAVVDGVSLVTIMRQWNDAGIRTSQGYRWNAREVGRVLRRPRNAGFMEYQGQITGRASWPPAVDETTWRAAVAILNREDRRTTTSPARRHLLSGLARCGECGAGVVTTKTRSGRLVYRCAEGEQGNRRRGHIQRDAVSLEDFVSRLTVARLSRPDAARLLAPDHRSELESLEREAAAVRVLMTEANELRTEGLITKLEFAAGRRRHMERLGEVEARMSVLGQSDVLTPMVVRFGDAVAAGNDTSVVWEDLPLDTRRGVIGALMEIWVRPAPRGRPAGWRPGQPYFDPDFIEIRWRREPG